MKGFLLVSLMLTLTSTFCYAQTTDDEKYEQANKYYDAKEFGKAIPILKELATKDHAKALNLLGMCYKYGRGVPKDVIKKMELYQRSANLGYAVAQRNLGISYQLGDGVEKDLDKAISCYIKAAEGNDQKAMVNLGWIYRSEEFQNIHSLEDMNSDYYYKQAEKWFRVAAKENNAEGLYGLACFYLDIYPGDDIIERMKKSAPFFFKAAELNYGYAQIAVGYADMREKKYRSALEWFNKALRNGCKKNYGLLTETWITVSKFFIDNPQYSFYWDNDCCNFNHEITEEDDYIYVGATLNSKFGFLKLSKIGKVIGKTPFIYDSFETDIVYPYYNKETRLFHVFLNGEEKTIDITGKEIIEDTVEDEDF